MDRNYDEKALVFETDFPYGGHLQGQWLATLSSFLWLAADSKETQKPLLTFIIDLAHALWLSGKSKSVGRPSKRSLSFEPAVGKKGAFEKPVSDVRYDVVDHFLKYREKRGRYQYCPNGYSSVYCKKCSMMLCLWKDNFFFLTWALNFSDEYKNVLYIFYFCLLCLFLHLLRIWNYVIPLCLPLSIFKNLT